MDRCEFEATLVYIVSSRSPRDTQRNTKTPKTPKLSCFEEQMVTSLLWFDFLWDRRHTNNSMEISY